MPERDAMRAQLGLSLLLEGDLAATGKEGDVREEAVFALAHIRAGGAVEALMHLARAHPDPTVRRSAVFWLGRSDDPRAAAFFDHTLGSSV